MKITKNGHFYEIDKEYYSRGLDKVSIYEIDKNGSPLKYLGKALTNDIEKTINEMIEKSEDNKWKDLKQSSRKAKQ